MSATYATQTFVCALSTGGTHLVVEGGQRDTVTSQAAVDHPTLFSAGGAPVAGKGHVDGKLAQYLASYPAGP
jgi:hypothetical protein